MKKPYWIIVLLLFIILPAGLFFIQERESEKRGVEKSELSEDGAYLEIAGFSFVEYISGQKKVEIKAEKASIGPKRIGFFKTPLIKEAHMVKPQIFFFTEAKLLSHIMADSGKMNMGNKKIILKGGVVLVTPDGKRLSAKQMAVDPKGGLLFIKGDFTLNKNSDTIKGRGLKSDIDLKNW